jgi:hypothetical protein
MLFETDIVHEEDPPVKAELHEAPEHKRGGWFDIVMGSNEAESESEDDSQRKRQYRYTESSSFRPLDGN